MDTELVKEIRNELEQSLVCKWKSELNGQINRLGTDIVFNLNEIKLYLDRNEPNVQGALNRVYEIQAILLKASEKAAKTK